MRVQIARLEGGRAVGDKGRTGFGDTVRERELEVRDKELPDIGAADVIGLLNLNDTKNLR